MRSISKQLNNTLFIISCLIFLVFLLTIFIVNSYYHYHHIKSLVMDNNQNAVNILTDYFKNIDIHDKTIKEMMIDSEYEELAYLLNSNRYFENLYYVENEEIIYTYQETTIYDVSFNNLYNIENNQILTNKVIKDIWTYVNKIADNKYLIYIVNRDVLGKLQYLNTSMSSSIAYLTTDKYFQVNKESYGFKAVFLSRNFATYQKVEILNTNVYLVTNVEHQEIYLCILEDSALVIGISLLILILLLLLLYFRNRQNVFKPLKHFIHEIELIEENDIHYFESINENQSEYIEFSNILTVIKKLSYYSKSKYENIIQNLKKELNEAQETIKSKLLFLANMSHEMRTPLNSIIGYTQLTQKIGFDNLEKVKEYFENIQNSSDILLQKVNDILDFSKIESKHFKLLEKPTNISKLVKEVYDLLKIQADRKNLNFSYILDPYLPEYLEIDEIRLKQVLINICSNAIKFTDKGSVKMQVKVFGYTNDAIYLEYIISDTGIGIPKDKIDTIFVPFVQANNSNDYPGTGLGLAIARDIIRLMGGDINVVSKENVGSIFSFITKFKITSYYRQKVSEMIDVDNDTFSALIKDKKILVCEDNLINQVLIKEIFALFNKKDIDIAKDGFEAINKCKDKLYDCILMDIKMPNLNGLEATKIIKNLIQYKNVPIIALTANVFSDQIKEYLLVGMIDYLSKPIDIKKLKNVLYQQLVVGD